MQAARHKNGDYVTVSERQCTKCFAVKPYTQFHRKASGPGGLQPHCITCMKVRICGGGRALGVHATFWGGLAARLGPSCRSDGALQQLAASYTAA